MQCRVRDTAQPVCFICSVCRRECDWRCFLGHYSACVHVGRSSLTLKSPIILNDSFTSLHHHAPPTLISLSTSPSVQQSVKHGHTCWRNMVKKQVFKMKHTYIVFMETTLNLAGRLRTDGCGCWPLWAPLTHKITKFNSNKPVSIQLKEALE